MEGVCKHCGALWSEHDHEQLARECYPKQIERLRLVLNKLLEWQGDTDYAWKYIIRDALKETA